MNYQDPNEIVNGRTPLIRLIEQKSPVEYFQILVDRGADVNFKKYSPLLKLMENFYDTIVFDFLIESGAECDESILESAIRHNVPASVIKIIIKKSSISNINFLIALAINNQEIVEYLLNVDSFDLPSVILFTRVYNPTMQHLIDLSDVNKTYYCLDNYGEYHDYDSENDDLYGIYEVDTKNGYSPLMLATVYDELPLVDALLKAGADINYKKSTGRSALFVAIKYAPRIAVELIKRGADTSAKYNGMTVVEYYNYYHSEIINIGKSLDMF